MHRTASALALALTLSTFARAAQADDESPAVTAQAKQHFKRGQEAFQAGNYDLAITELKNAYQLKPLPAILFNIATTYRKMKDTNNAAAFFKQFLSEAPDNDKLRPQAEAALKSLESEARSALPAVSPAAPASASAPPPPAMEWSHAAIDAVPPGETVDVRVQMPVMKGVKVKVFYRHEGQAAWDSQEMKRRGREKVARLPASVASGRTFQYYIEARDSAGGLIKSAGSEVSPNVVLIDPAAARQLAEGQDDEGGEEEKGAAFSRDIENEQVTFDPRSGALRQQSQGPQKSHGPFGKLGWTGVGVASGGALVLVGGTVFLGLASFYAGLVSSDSQCGTKVAGGCPHFSANPTSGMSLALQSPTSADYESQGKTFNTVGIALGVVGGAALLAGVGLMTYDAIKHRDAAEVQSHPRKRKARRAVELEDGQSRLDLRLAPVLSPTLWGAAGELRF